MLTLSLSLPLPLRHFSLSLLPPSLCVKSLFNFLMFLRLQLDDTLLLSAVTLTTIPEIRILSGWTRLKQADLSRKLRSGSRSSDRDCPARWWVDLGAAIEPGSSPAGSDNPLLAHPLGHPTVTCCHSAVTVKEKGNAITIQL